MRTGEQFTRKTWANPREAVAHVYQTGYWGIWMFQLESVQQDQLVFARGGGRTHRATRRTLGHTVAPLSKTGNR